MTKYIPNAENDLKTLNSYDAIKCVALAVDVNTIIVKNE